MSISDKNKLTEKANAVLRALNELNSEAKLAVANDKSPQHCEHRGPQQAALDFVDKMVSDFLFEFQEVHIDYLLDCFDEGGES